MYNWLSLSATFNIEYEKYISTPLALHVMDVANMGGGYLPDMYATARGRVYCIFQVACELKYNHVITY